MDWSWPYEMAKVVEAKLAVAHSVLHCRDWCCSIASAEEEKMHMKSGQMLAGQWVRRATFHLRSSRAPGNRSYNVDWLGYKWPAGGGQQAVDTDIAVACFDYVVVADN